MRRNRQFENNSVIRSRSIWFIPFDVNRLYACVCREDSDGGDAPLIVMITASLKITFALVWSSTVRQTGKKSNQRFSGRTANLYISFPQEKLVFIVIGPVSERGSKKKKNLHSFLSIWFTRCASEIMRRSSTSMSLQAQVYFLISIPSWRLERRMSKAKTRRIWYGRLAVINPVSKTRLEDISDHCCFSFLLRLRHVESWRRSIRCTDGKRYWWRFFFFAARTDIVSNRRRDELMFDDDGGRL